MIHLRSGEPHDSTINLNIAGSVSHGYFFVGFKLLHLKTLGGKNGMLKFGICISFKIFRIKQSILS